MAGTSKQNISATKLYHK